MFKKKIFFLSSAYGFRFSHKILRLFWIIQNWIKMFYRKWSHGSKCSTSCFYTFWHKNVAANFVLRQFFLWIYYEARAFMGVNVEFVRTPAMNTLWFYLNKLKILDYRSRVLFLRSRHAFFRHFLKTPYKRGLEVNNSDF